jgi:3-oxoacyl-(acyl-carrier-protein) synthase
MNKIYINSIKQISAQQPLLEDWFKTPIRYSEEYVRSIEPDYKQFFTPNEARRYGKILKRALLVSRQVMEESGITLPDAIVTGTGLGCIESTEIFLDKLVRDGEEFLNPTHFMQSTHNTIGSLIAIDTKCNAYNSTYAHKGISFECALQDAFLQMQKNGGTALVGAHDEMLPAYYTLLKKSGYLGKPNQTFAGETAVAMMLSADKTEKIWCEIEAVEKIYTGNRHCGLDTQYCKSGGLRIKSTMTNDIDYIMVGTNGDLENDNIYFKNCAKLFPNVPLLKYKHIFGESYTAPALGVYAAATCLQRGKIPEQLRITNYELRKNDSNVNKILCYNHFEGKNHTFILLSK